MDTVQLCGMEEIMEKGKWTTTSLTKGWSSSKGDIEYTVGLEGNPLLWTPSGEPNNKFQVLLPVRPTEGSAQQKSSGVSQLYA